MESRSSISSDSDECTSAGRMAFSGGLEAPAQQASIDAHLFWDPKINVGDATAGIGLGVLSLHAVLSTNPGEHLYTLTLGLGDGAARPGAEAKLNLSKLLGALGSIVNITAIDESYSPALTLTQGEAPKFELGHKSQP